MLEQSFRLIKNQITIVRFFVLKIKIIMSQKINVNRNHFTLSNKIEQNSIRKKIDLKSFPKKRKAINILKDKIAVSQTDTKFLMFIKS